jgi:hypothetical protein
MIAWNCPIGRLVCDGCDSLTTGGCIKKNTPTAISITQNDIDMMYERRKKELMALSKEDLVELILGRHNRWDF